LPNNAVKYGLAIRCLLLVVRFSLPAEALFPLVFKTNNERQTTKNDKTMTLDDVKIWASHRPTLADALGIELTDITADYLEGRMPVDGRTHQPMGLLHGGASVALAETLGSIGAATRIDVTRQACVGLEINANHIKGVRDGWVRGRATALHVGRSTQVWEIRITHEETGALVCISRITMAVIDLPAGRDKQA
jgi:uncharacterized protein (TIGR00369 family)